MRKLKKKEAAGSPIRIDTESIGDFETLANESIEDDDVTLGDIPMTPGIIAPLEDEVMGNMVCPEPPEVITLQGDVEAPEEESEDVD